jgi:hypothetical protein
MDHWRLVCSRYGWAHTPLLFYTHDELKLDNPMLCAISPRSSSTLAVGIPHPQHGVMRVSVHVTVATSLTRLVSIVKNQLDTSAEFLEASLPEMYVGDRVFTDFICGEQREVLGILVYRTARGAEYSALAVVRWQSGTGAPLWLPYFEDVNGWVMTGWDTDGRVHEIFKPFGWGSPGASVDAVLESVGSS